MTDQKIRLTLGGASKGVKNCKSALGLFPEVG
jgi:hypothetical protein